MDSEGFEYLATGSPICNDFESFKNIFHEVDIDQFKRITVDEMLKNKHEQIAMNIWQMYAFVNDWFKNSQPFSFLMENWSVKKWFVDYLESVKTTLLSGKYECGLDFKNDLFTYHEDFAVSAISEALNIISFKGIQKTENCVVFDEKRRYKPEFSWQVEDFLAKRIQGKVSPYWKSIEPILRANMRNFQFYTGIHGAVRKNLINVPSRLTKLYSQDKIDVNSQEFEDVLMDCDSAIFLFQTPYMFHSPDTNFLYIEKLLVKYRYERK